MPAPKRHLEKEIRAACYNCFTRSESNLWLKKQFYVDILHGKLKEEKLDLIYLVYNTLMYNAKQYSDDVSNSKSRPYWQYIVSDDVCDCDVCNQVKDKVFLFDNKIWNELYPPNHLGCTAHIKPLTEQEIKLLGLEVTQQVSPSQQKILWAFNPAKVNLTEFIEGIILNILKNNKLKFS